jgi:hypothetical protein
MQRRQISFSALMVVIAVTSKGAARQGQQADTQETRASLSSSSRSVIEEGFVPIGGIAQWVSIRGKVATAPVLSSYMVAREPEVAQYICQRLN